MEEHCIAEEKRYSIMLSLRSRLQSMTEADDLSPLLEMLDCAIGSYLNTTTASKKAKVAQAEVKTGALIGATGAGTGFSLFAKLIKPSDCTAYLDSLLQQRAQPRAIFLGSVCAK